MCHVGWDVGKEKGIRADRICDGHMKISLRKSEMSVL